MDYCDICFDRPQPLVIHFIDLEAKKRVWFSGDRAVYTVTVQNRSTLPMTQVKLTGGSAAFLGGSVRVNGLPEREASPGRGILLPGLDAGGRALVSWEEENGSALTEAPVTVTYEYGFCGETLTGEVLA